MINSKILKRKFTVDTSLNHLYQMNQKSFKKSLSIISSKDDSATASLLGFAIANRVESGAADKGESTGVTMSSLKKDKDAKDRDDGAAGTSSHHTKKEDKDGDKVTASTAKKDHSSAQVGHEKEGKPRKNKHNGSS